MRVSAILAMAIFISIATAYLAMSRLYAGRFGYGIWVNGVYATGLKPAEVTEILDGQAEGDGGLPAVVLLIGRDDTRLAIPTEQLSMQASYASSVRKLYTDQNMLTWFRGLAGGIRYDVTARTTFDLSALEEAVDQWEIFDTDEEESVRIESGPEGYHLVTRATSVPVKEEILRVAADKIGGGEYYVSLDTDGACYREQEITDQDRSVMKTWEAIEQTRLKDLYYLIGDERIPLDAAVTDEWILTAAELHALTYGGGNPAAAGAEGRDPEEAAEDPASRYLVGGESMGLPADAHEVNGFAESGNGELIIKEGGIATYVRAMCERYDTLDKVRDFKTEDGRVVQVPPGTYGNKIDEKAETEWLTEAVKEHRSQVHIPKMLHEAKYLGDDDIGGTYIEVDIAKQMLYYFVNGRIDTQIPVVTGNQRTRCDTPPGVYDIYCMQRNRTLRGENYTSFVYYWIAFYGNYGIHDATWRGSFGEEIYLTSGSHGCVNIPVSEAGPLYQKLSLGVPVIVHE